MKELFENWGDIKAGLLQGLPENKKAIMSPLLENQKQQILNETATSGSTDTGAIAGFRKIMIPMIRRIIPNSVGTELVGVQPMSGPVGLVYSMRYRYADALTVDPSVMTSLDNGIGNIPGAGTDMEAFGNVNQLRRFYSGATDVAQPAGAGGFDQPGISGNPTGRGWPSALDAAAGTGAGPLHGGGSSFLEGSAGRKMTMEIISQAVESKSRKLQATWTIEAMQDLNSQHGLDIETEMTRALSTQITQEIDNEIITDLLSLAGTVSSWDGALPVAAGYYKPTFVGDRLSNIAVQVNQISNEIARKTRKQKGATWMLCSPMIVSALQSAGKSVFAPTTAGTFDTPNDSKLVGTLNGSIKVYSYLWNDARTTDLGGAGNDTILLGHKGGDGETDSGYFYCPYIPLMSSGVIMNPVTTQPMVSLLCRYGKSTFTSQATSLGNSADYYGKMSITNLSLL